VNANGKRAALSCGRGPVRSFGREQAADGIAQAEQDGRAEARERGATLREPQRELDTLLDDRSIAVQRLEGDDAHRQPITLTRRASRRCRRARAGAPVRSDHCEALGTISVTSR